MSLSGRVGRTGAALLSLGKTGEEIAANLEKAGIVGEKSNCPTCPIHNYLFKIDPDLAEPGWYTILLDNRRRGNFIAVLDFITRFDDDKFPRLMKER